MTGGNKLAVIVETMISKPTMDPRLAKAAGALALAVADFEAAGSEPYMVKYRAARRAMFDRLDEYASTLNEVYR